MKTLAFQVPRIQTAMGSNTFDFRASLAWNNLPACLKFLNETDFKAEVSKCTIYCSCKLCKWIRLFFFQIFHFIMYIYNCILIVFLNVVFIVGVN